jgi:hypothetical protein
LSNSGHFGQSAIQLLEQGKHGQMQLWKSG